MQRKGDTAQSCRIQRDMVSRMNSFQPMLVAPEARALKTAGSLMKRGYLASVYKTWYVLGKGMGEAHTSSSLALRRSRPQSLRM